MCICCCVKLQNARCKDKDSPIEIHHRLTEAQEVGIMRAATLQKGDRGGTVVKVLCYKSEGRWFDPSWCQWIFR